MFILRARAVILCKETLKILSGTEGRKNLIIATAHPSNLIHSSAHTHTHTLSYSNHVLTLALCHYVMKYQSQ
jgi:hypothetical protein